MKKSGIAVLVLLLAAGGALFWLRGNLDGLVKEAIEKYGSAMTQAPVRVAAVEIKAGDGRGVIRGLTVGNPAGFMSAYALSVAEIEIDIDLASVASDVVTLKRIAILAPDIIYEKSEATTNFDALQRNIAAYLGPAETKAGGKKLIVAELVVRNAKAAASATALNGRTVAIDMPDIALRDLGKARGGISAGELGHEIVAALRQKLAGGFSFEKLMKSAGKTIEEAGKAIQGLFGK